MKFFLIFRSDEFFISESHLLVTFSTIYIYFTLLAELVGTGPMRARICSMGWFDQDNIQITMQMSSLMKFRIIDHELYVCEYGLRSIYNTTSLLCHRLGRRGLVREQGWGKWARISWPCPIHTRHTRFGQKRNDNIYGTFRCNSRCLFSVTVSGRQLFQLELVDAALSS